MYILKVLVLLIAFFLPVTPIQPTVAKVDVTKAVKRLLFDNAEEWGSCSSIAVNSKNKNAVLTAQHCLENKGDLIIDGTKVEIESQIPDHNDHVILLLKGIKFPVSVPLKLVKPVQGLKVFYYGYPEYVFDDNGKVLGTVQYYEGYFSGVGSEGGRSFDVFDLRAFPGDSGGTILDENLNIVGMISGSHGALSASYQIKFTAEQLQQLDK